MFTFGPIAPDDHQEARLQILRLARDACAGNLEPGQLHMAFEHGSSGDGDIAYEHCHLIVGFNSPQKPPMRLVKQLKELCHVDADGRRPNLGMNYVPRGDKVAAKIGAYNVLLKYITTPHKKKEVDEGVLDFVPPPPCRLPRKPHHVSNSAWTLATEILPALHNDIKNGYDGITRRRGRNPAKRFRVVE